MERVEELAEGWEGASSDLLLAGGTVDNWKSQNLGVVSCRLSTICFP